MRNMIHEISIDELEQWMSQEMVLFASSGKEKKRLLVGFNGIYQIHHKGDIVLKTRLIKKAIEVYNELY